MTNKQDEKWLDSPERLAIRRVQLACLACVLVPGILAAAILWQQKIDAANAVTRAYEATRQAENDVSEAESAESAARVDLEEARASLRLAEVSVLPTAGRTERLQEQVDYAMAEVERASARTQMMADQLRSARATELRANDRADGAAGSWLLYLGAMTALTIVSILFYRYVRSEKRREYENRLLVEGMTIDNQTAKDVLSLESLWRENREQLQRYHQLVLNYASSSRQTTLIALLTGFSFLLIVGVVALFADSTASAISSSVVAAAGAALTGFIARAVLRNADASSREVLAFFSHPIDVERVLAAERVVVAMPEQSQEKGKLLIVRALTNARTKSARDS